MKNRNQKTSAVGSRRLQKPLRLAFSAIALLPLGCGLDSQELHESATRGGTAEATPVTAEQAIIGGTAVDGLTRRTLGLVAVGDASGGHCSGALVTTDWVLTASHCINFAMPEANGFTTAGPDLVNATNIRWGINAIRLKNTDLAMVQLAPMATPGEWPTIALQQMYDGDSTKLVGQNITCYGRGATAYAPGGGFTGGTVWNSVTKPVTGYVNTWSGKSYYELVISATSTGTEIPAPGDSGGPCYVGNKIVSVNSWGELDCINPTTEDTCKATATKVKKVHSADTHPYLDYIHSIPAIMPLMPTTLQLVTTEISAGPNQLMHRIRYADGTWATLGDIEAQAGDIGSVQHAAIQTSRAGHTHVLASNSLGKLYHAVRTTDGQWSPFGDLGAVAGLSGSVSDLAIADVRDEMHMLVVSDGSLLHNIFSNNYTWSPFGNVEGVIGDVGWIRKVSAAGDRDGNLHVCVLNTANQLFHTIRYPTSWAPFGLVTDDQTWDVSCSVVAGELHVTRARAAWPHGLEHRIRHADGSWAAWGDVDAVTGTAVKFNSVSTSEVNGDLYVIAGNDGALFHAIRYSSPASWSGFVSLSSQAGFPSFVSYDTD